MKIRKIVIGYTLGMFLLLFVMFQVFTVESSASNDMVFYNEQRILVEKAIEEEEPLGKIEETYGCSIFLLTDKNYELELDEALQEEALIFDYRKGKELKGKIVWNVEEKKYQKLTDKMFLASLVGWGILYFAGYFFLVVLYIQFLRPFGKLQYFSRQVAKGNLDFPLPIQKHNFFGAFTESFDLMREELKRARESEYQANQSKKELVAELSHDIKTPIATIQATCEVMQLKEKNPDTLEKVEVIASKAKMIDNLIGNLFHATLEELEVLKVETVEESSLCISEMFQELKVFGEIHLKGEIPQCLLYMDKLRLQQVIDNVIHNAWKYAGTAVTVTFEESTEGIKIKIKDGGPGVPTEDLMQITEKFYRGSNAKGKAGSGLGLYLTKLFMEQMQGGMECYNEDGFVVELFLRKV